MLLLSKLHMCKRVHQRAVPHPHQQGVMFCRHPCVCSGYDQAPLFRRGGCFVNTVELSFSEKAKE
jgi:hypothetical protein